MDTSCKRFIKFGFIISVTCAVLFTVSVYFNNLNFTFKQQSYNVFNISANDNEKKPQSFENNAVRKDDNLGTAKLLKDKVYGAQNVYTTKRGKYSVQDNSKTELVHKALPSVLEDRLITEYSRKRNDSEDPSQLIKEVCRKLPDVLIVGVEKCGTVTLRQFLGIHPSIFITEKRGNNKFFNRDNNKSPVELAESRPCTPSGQLRLEKLATPGDAALVYKYLPDVKLIVIVKEPVERLMSRFLHVQALNKIRNNVTDFEQWLHMINLDKKANYFVHEIQPWIELFGIERLLVIDGDVFVRDPVEELRKAEKFLGLSPFFTNNTFQYNATKRFYCIKSTTGDGCMYEGKGRPHPVMRNETRNSLKTIFRPRNEEFFKLVGRRFPWNDQ